jgi:hypothetical protein
MQTKSILFITSLLGLGLAGAPGCGSSSSGGNNANGTDSGTGDDSGSSSSGGEAGIAITCMDSSSCTGGQVCCVSLMGTTPSVACAAAPCAPLAIVGISVQLCTKDSECPSGEVCGKTGNALVDMTISGMGGKACGASEGGTTGDGGGSSSGSTTDGGHDGGTDSGGSSGGGDSGTDSGSSGGDSGGGSDAPAG